MSYLVYLTLLPPIILGTLLISALTLPTRKGNVLLFISLGIPLGFGLVSLLFFLWVYLFSSFNPGFFIIEFLLLGYLIYLNWKKREFLAGWIPDVKNITKTEWGLIGLFVLVAGIGLAAFILYTNANPHGRYDAWAIWNVRARMLTRAGEYWRTIFIPQVFHADYPLLVPISIAHSWLMAGTESQRIPQAVAGLFTFSSAGIIAGTLLALRKKAFAWVAGIVFLGTPWVIYFGSLQFADLPLAACMAGATACLVIGLTHKPDARRWFILAGLFAGIAAWTKNEGQLFLLVFSSITVISILFTFKKHHPLVHLFQLATGLALPFLVILIFKFTLAPANDVIDPEAMDSSMSLLFSPSRYMEVVNAYLAYPKGFGGWPVPFPLIFLVSWFCMKPRITKENKSAILTTTVILAMQWIGYFLVYVITPHQLQSHINQSYDRLLMQMYPSFIILIFLLLSPADSAIVGSLNTSESPAV